MVYNSIRGVHNLYGNIRITYSFFIKVKRWYLKEDYLKLQALEWCWAVPTVCMLVLGLADYLVTTDTFAMDSQNLDNLHQIGSLQNCMSLILQSRNYLTPVVCQVWSAVKLKYVIRYNNKRYLARFTWSLLLSLKSFYLLCKFIYIIIGQLFANVTMSYSIRNLV